MHKTYLVHISIGENLETVYLNYSQFFLSVLEQIPISFVKYQM